MPLLRHGSGQQLRESALPWPAGSAAVIGSFDHSQPLSPRPPRPLSLGFPEFGPSRARAYAPAWLRAHISPFFLSGCLPGYNLSIT